MEWQLDSERPIYAQLMEHIERALVTGLWPPGSRVPGVRELAAQAGVNPNTMQRALGELEARGLLHSQRTSGRFVTEDPAAIAALRQRLAQSLAAAFIKNMRALGCTAAETDSFFAQAKEELI